MNRSDQISSSGESTLDCCDLLAQLNRTQLGSFLDMPHSYLSITRRSPYVNDHQRQSHESAGTTMDILDRKCLIIYPFVKTHDWYQLPKEERQSLMNDHFAIGHRYPEVKISTVYSFDLADQEFMLGFETAEASKFLDLVEELRGSEARTYTLRDTSIFTCVKKSLKACLDDLG